MANTPKPVHLKVVDKAHAHLYDFDNPEPSKDWPVTPSYLSPTAQGIFERLVLRIADLYPPSASHTEMIALYAQSEEEARELEVEIKWEGRTIDTPRGTPVANPKVAMLKDARTRCMNILKEFGLSPNAARNVKIEKKSNKRNAFADLDD